MKKNLLAFLILLAVIVFGCNQPPPASPQHAPQVAGDTNSDLQVGGACDGCDIIFEGMPSMEKINWEAHIAAANEPGEKMEILGTLFKKDGKTPASDVVLYFYHTDATGNYTASDTQTTGRRNGYLRGWMKTDAAGKFKIYSIRPAPYPSNSMPAHIHMIVKEKGMTRYYIDEIWFDDDPLISSAMKKNAEGRGGNLIMHLSRNSNKTWVGQLNITLGLNIPRYQ